MQETQTQPNLDQLPPPPDQATQDAWADSQRKIISSAGRSEEKAAEVMEKMDHKNVLYRNLGDIATGGAGTELHRDPQSPPHPRSFAERLLDKRVDKKAQKHAKAITNQAHAAKTFGEADELPGTSKTERVVAKASIMRRRHSGQLSAREARMAKISTDAEELKLGKKMHKRRYRKLNGKIRGAAGKAKRSVWPARATRRIRSPRKDRAIGRIQEAHARAEEARQNLRSMGQSEQPLFDPETGELL